MAAHRPRLQPRRRLAAELRRLAGALTRWADGADPAPPPAPAERRPGEPPEHWLALVRERAPELLEGGGLGYSLDPGPSGWRPAPAGATAAHRPGPRRVAPARREARPVAAAVTSAGAPPGGTESGGSSDGDVEPPAVPTSLLSRVVARLRRHSTAAAPARPTGQGWGGPVGLAGDVPGSQGAPAPAFPAAPPPHPAPAGAAPAVGSRGAPPPAFVRGTAGPGGAVAAPAAPVVSQGAPEAGARLPLVGRPAWQWPAGEPVESHGAAVAFDVLPPAPAPAARFSAPAVERPPASGPVAAPVSAAPWPTLPPAPGGARLRSAELTAADGRWPDLPDDRELRAFDAAAAAPDRDRLDRLAQEQRGYD